MSGGPKISYGGVILVSTRGSEHLNFVIYFEQEKRVDGRNTEGKLRLQRQISYESMEI